MFLTYHIMNIDSVLAFKVLSTTLQDLQKKVRRGNHNNFSHDLYQFAWDFFPAENIRDHQNKSNWGNWRSVLDKL